MRTRSATALALTLCGCTFPFGYDGPELGSASIGPAGGSVSLADGPRLIIPPGALSAPTTISIVRSGAAAPERSFSGVYRFQPETTVFAQPVSVIFPLPNGISDAVVYWTAIDPAAGYEMLTAHVEAGLATAQVTHLGTGYGGVRPAAMRTVSGALSTIFWADDGTRTVRNGVLPPEMRVSAVLVPEGNGYHRIPVTQAADSSFTVSGVAEGRYLLQVDTIYPATANQSALVVNQLIELTTSTPDLSTIVAGRPDLEIATAPTEVTLDISNLTPWVRAGNGFVGDALLIAGSQAHVYSRPSAPGLPAASATSSRFGFDWALATTASRTGLPDASKGDVEYIYQRSTRPIGSGVTAGMVHSASRFQTLNALTLRNGSPASVPVQLTDMPQTGSIHADLRQSQFAALASQANPRARPSALPYGVSVLALPHSIDFPDQPGGGASTSLLWIQTPSSGDVDYGVVGYGQLPAPLWQEMRYVYYAFDVDVTNPGSGKSYPWGATLISYVPQGSPGPIAPALGPPRSPTIEGRDAFVSQSGVGVTPTLSWSAPALGSATSYLVRIDMITESPPPSGYKEILLSVYSGTSVRLPSGLLQPGQPYIATISAMSAPWDTLDRPPFRTGTPLHLADCLTAVFVP